MPWWILRYGVASSRALPLLTWTTCNGWASLVSRPSCAIRTRSSPDSTTRELLAALETLSGRDTVVGLHAENHSLLTTGIANMRAAGRKDPMAHAESRPSIVEAEAVNRAIFYSRRTGTPVHIVHMSAPDSAELVRRAKREGVHVSCETAAHYLTLSTDDLERLGPFGRCAPALRSSAEVERMWEYVLDGTIDCLATDHCAFTAESKHGGDSDIFLAPNGLPEIQTNVPVFIELARQRAVSWSRITDMLSRIPSAIWGLDSRKGAIRVGLDADLVIFDPESDWVIRGEELLQAQKWTPYEGRAVRGRIVRTLVRGVTVYDQGSDEVIRVRPGFGEFVERPA